MFRQLLNRLGFPTADDWKKASPFEKLGYFAAVCAVVTLVSASFGYLSSFTKDYFSEPDYLFYTTSPGLGVEIVQDGIPQRIRRENNKVLLEPREFIVRRISPSAFSEDNAARFEISTQTHNDLTQLLVDSAIHIEDIGTVVVIQFGTGFADHEYSSSKLWLDDEVSSFEARGAPHVLAFWSVFLGNRLNASSAEGFGAKISSIEDEYGNQFLKKGQSLFVTLMDTPQKKASIRSSVALPLRAFETFEIEFK